MLPTFCPPTIWTISLEFYRKPSILAADDFLGACYRKAMTPQKLWTLFFSKSCLFRKTREGWNNQFQKTPRTEGGDKVQGSVDPRFPAGLPFPVPEILEFVASRDSGKCSSNFPGTFPEQSSGTPEQTPETATAFSSFLTCPSLNSETSLPTKLEALKGGSFDQGVVLENRISWFSWFHRITGMCSILQRGSFKNVTLSFLWFS